MSGVQEQFIAKPHILAMCSAGAGVLIVGLILVAGSLARSWPSTFEFDCATARSGALQIVKDYPFITVPYSGEQEKQCQLNEVVRQGRIGAHP